MGLFRDLAKRVRTHRKVVVRRSKLEYASREYIMTNGKFLIAMDPDEYEKFRKKYNGYKTAVSIPDVPKGKTVYHDQSEGDSFLEGDYQLSKYFELDLNDYRKVELTDYYKQSGGKRHRICHVDGEGFITYDCFYRRLIDNAGGVASTDLVTKGEGSPIHVLDKAGTTQAVFVPSSTGDVVEDLRQLVEGEFAA